MKIRKHTLYIRTQYFTHRIQYPLHPDTMSCQLVQTTESQLKILKVRLGWLQILICRVQGLRPLMRKISC